MASDEDVAKLTALAEADEVSMAHVIRLLVKEAYRVRFGDIKPPKLKVKAR